MEEQIIERVGIFSGLTMLGDFFICNGYVANGETADSLLKRFTEYFVLGPDKVIKEKIVNGNVTKTELYNLKKYYSYEVDEKGMYFYGAFDYPHRIVFKFSKQEGGE